MKHVCKHIMVLITALLCTALLHAQVNVRATVDRNKILIGEPIVLTIEAYTPLGAPVDWLKQDTIPHFEINNRSAIDTVENIDGKKIVQTLTITSFDSGRWQIPAFEILVGGQPYYSDSVDVDVAFISFDPKEDYRDIKDIIEIVDPAMKYMPWIIAALAITSLAFIIVIVRNKKLAHIPAQKADIFQLSAYQEAMEGLDVLGKKEVNEGGEKNYYSEMNDILRKYVSRKFRISTFERTNEELIMQLSKLSIPKEAFISLTQSLRMSDFVKFAKYRPSAQDNKDNLKIVRSSIEILDNKLVSAV